MMKKLYGRKYNEYSFEFPNIQITSNKFNFLKRNMDGGDIPKLIIKVCE